MPACGSLTSGSPRRSRRWRAIGEIVAEARTVLSDGVRRIADDVRTSIDYYRAQEATVTVDRAVLTGPAEAIPGFTEQLAADLGIAVAARRRVRGDPRRAPGR